MAATYSELGHCRVIDLRNAGPESVDLSEFCDRIAWDEEARVVLVVFGPEAEQLLNAKLEAGESDIVEALARLKQPVIAAIQGDAMGTALELALACDIRIGIDTARFGMTQICDGWIPCSGGTQRLPRLIGQSKAMQMILLGERIDAAEACRIGLIHRAVPPELLVRSASAMASEMAARSPLSLSYAKEALYGSRDLTLDQGIRMEMDLYLLLFSTSDRTEGITAFRGKREPDFKGR